MHFDGTGISAHPYEYQKKKVRRDCGESNRQVLLSGWAKCRRGQRQSQICNNRTTTCLFIINQTDEKENTPFLSSKKKTQRDNSEKNFE